MAPWVQTVLAVFTSVMASSGLWAYLLGRREQKLKKKEKEEEKTSAKNRMLIGLGHDRIVNLCTKYIERGWITTEEYEDLNEYLYKPYKEMGGNGTAEKLMAEIRELPVKHISYLQKGKSKGFLCRLLGLKGA